MSTAIFGGPWDWTGGRDKDGYREYKLKYLIRATSVVDGPATVLQTPGAPFPGDLWIVGNDVDLWAWCRPDVGLSRHDMEGGEPGVWWIAEYTFSNKPLDRQRCQEQQIEDPLLEPPKISGSFVKYQEEAAYDRFGRRITTSSHEQIRGKEIEFDRNRPQVKIEINIPFSPVTIISSLIDTVNATEMWGLPPRCVKLSNAPWERKFYGQCYVYYTLTLEFDIRYDTFDRNVQDEGTKVLNGHWSTTSAGTGTGGENLWILDNIDGVAPDPNNPAHFIRFKDRKEENCRVILDGRGRPAANIGLTVDHILLGFTSGTAQTIITTTAPHGLALGDVVTLIGAKPTYYDDEYSVTKIDSTTTFRVTSRISSMAPWTSGGIVYAKGYGPGNVHVEAYNEVDFFSALGVPAIL